MKEKISDKYYKMKQNDQGTFTRLYEHCCLPSFGKDVRIDLILE